MGKRRTKTSKENSSFLHPFHIFFIQITLVPTFDGEELRQFFVNNKTHLAELNINILPAAIRCNVQYDGESSPAQRLRFNATDEQ